MPNFVEEKKLTWWGIFDHKYTELRFIAANWQDIVRTNQLCVLIAGFGFFLVSIADYMKIGNALPFYLCLWLRSFYLIASIMLYFWMKRRRSIQDVYLAMGGYSLTSQLVLQTLVIILNQDRVLDPIDQITIPLITISTFTFISIPLQLLALASFVSYLLFVFSLFFYYRVSTDHIFNMLLILAVMNTLGFFLFRFIHTSKRSSFAQSRQIGELNCILSVQMLKNTETSLKLKDTFQELTDSIIYAQALQMAFLPSRQDIQSIFPHHFIFYSPRNTVSGDFYWTAEIDGKKLVAVADCTGHGIPGAFMSILGISLFNTITRYLSEQGELPPAGQILNLIRSSLLSALSRNSTIGQRQEGMDVAFCIINQRTLSLQYAGAFSDLVLFRKNQLLLTIKGDKMPIGQYIHNNDFQTHTLPLFEGDTIYMFSDGFRDQFGGPQQKRFMRWRFNEMLVQCQQYTITEQLEHISWIFANWKGDNEQVDDVLVLGIVVE